MDTIEFDVAMGLLWQMATNLTDCRDPEKIRKGVENMKHAVQQIENSISMEVPKVCPKCQEKTTPGARYCAFCGNRVVRAEGGEADCS